MYDDDDVVDFTGKNSLEDVDQPIYPTSINIWNKQDFSNSYGRVSTRVPPELTMAANNMFNPYRQRTKNGKTELVSMFTDSLLEFIFNDGELIEYPIYIFNKTYSTQFGNYEVNSSDFFSGTHQTANPYVTLEDYVYLSSVSHPLYFFDGLSSKYFKFELSQLRMLPPEMTSAIVAENLSFNAVQNVTESEIFIQNFEDQICIVFLLLSNIPHVTLCVLNLSTGKLHTIGFGYHSFHDKSLLPSILLELSHLQPNGTLKAQFVKFSHFFEKMAGIFNSADTLTPSTNHVSKLIWVGMCDNNIIHKILTDLKKTTQIQFNGRYLTLVSVDETAQKISNGGEIVNPYTQKPINLYLFDSTSRLNTDTLYGEYDGLVRTPGFENCLSWAMTIVAGGYPNQYYKQPEYCPFVSEAEWQQLCQAIRSSIQSHNVSQITTTISEIQYKLVHYSLDVNQITTINQQTQHILQLLAQTVGAYVSKKDPTTNIQDIYSMFSHLYDYIILSSNQHAGKRRKTKRRKTKHRKNSLPIQMF